jgi:hypothetical protein
MLNFLEFLRVYTLLALSRLYLKTALQHHCHLPLQRCTATAKRTEGLSRRQSHATTLDKAQ